MLKGKLILQFPNFKFILDLTVAFVTGKNEDDLITKESVRVVTKFLTLSPFVAMETRINNWIWTKP